MSPRRKVETPQDAVNGTTFGQKTIGDKAMPGLPEAPASEERFSLLFGALPAAWLGRVGSGEGAT
ncbi:MAG: hypothetical protein E4G89_04195 [Methanothrix sp.]|nr:MAG: hypothetical protein E4G89_04195 [Methanothrix sp.]